MARRTLITPGLTPGRTWYRLGDALLNLAIAISDWRARRRTS